MWSRPTRKGVVKIAVITLTVNWQTTTDSLYERQHNGVETKMVRKITSQSANAGGTIVFMDSLPLDCVR